MRGLFFGLGILILTVFAASISQSPVPYGDNPAVGQTLKLGDIDLYYEEYGSGDPLLIVHGNGGSIKDMAPQIEPFSKSHRVIVADSRGHGKTKLGDGALTYEKITADLKALLNHLNIAKTDIIGWSDGGVVGLHMALGHPETVGKMVIFGANLFPGEPAIYPWLVEPMQQWDQAIVEGLKEDPESEGWKLQRQHVDLMMKMTPITKEMLKEIKAPTLVAAADKDALTNHHTVDIFEGLPNAHLAILPGATHWEPLRNPTLFNQLASDFLSKPYARPTSQEIALGEGQE